MIPRAMVPIHVTDIVSFQDSKPSAIPLRDLPDEYEPKDFEKETRSLDEEIAPSMTTTITTALSHLSSSEYRVLT